LTNPLSKNEHQKINKYKKENNCAIIMSPIGGNIFEWLIDDDKLYLISVKFKQHINYTTNVIDNIFHTKKLLASCVNNEIKLIISKKELGADAQKKMTIEREILIMDFQNGILVNSTKEIEQYSSSSLKYYIDEE
jgi:hypothetical protein